MGCARSRKITRRTKKKGELTFFFPFLTKNFFFFFLVRKGVKSDLDSKRKKNGRRLVLQAAKKKRAVPFSSFPRQNSKVAGSRSVQAGEDSVGFFPLSAEHNTKCSWFVSYSFISAGLVGTAALRLAGRLQS